jgi:pimeloyl-ACP methyl ester carboxylesterase
MSDDIRPFRIDVPDADLDDLRDRLRRTRWPEPEPVGDWSQGTPLAYWNELDKGGHFAAFEQPETFVTEVRAAFRPLRQD